MIGIACLFNKLNHSNMNCKIVKHQFIKGKTTLWHKQITQTCSSVVTVIDDSLICSFGGC